MLGQIVADDGVGERVSVEGVAVLAPGCGKEEQGGTVTVGQVGFQAVHVIREGQVVRMGGLLNRGSGGLPELDGKI